MHKPIISTPGARKLISSLRDVGYDFNTAVADLVDNSITAGATEIEITMRFRGPDSWVRIVDNGRGMNENEITEAMRFGSEREYKHDDLGKFGLGLKTASISQCKKLTIASHQSQRDSEIQARRWDLDHIERINSWELLAIAPGDLPENIREKISGRLGTVVLWENLDRLNSFTLPYGEAAKNSFLKMAESLQLYLGMVFERFISGTAFTGTSLKITINGTPIEPWDPFARQESATKHLQVHSLPLMSTKSGVSARVRVDPYILPRQDKFSSKNAHELATGPNRWNQQQGLYFYRADRMIQSGGWSRLRTADEHTKLARIAIDFSPALDDMFKVDIAKAKVQVPSDLRQRLKEIVDTVASEAKAEYDRKGSAHTVSASVQYSAQAGSATPKTANNYPPSVELFFAGSSKPTTEEAPDSVSELDVPETSETAWTEDNKVGKIAGDTRNPIAHALKTAARDVGATEALADIQQAVRRDFPSVADKIGW